MQEPTRDPQQAIPLTPPVFHILLALADGRRHGYAIIQDVENRTSGKVRLSAGTLYAAMRRLLDSGMIAETRRRPAPEADDQRRRYYRITEFGLEVAAAETERLNQLVGLATGRKLLSARLAALRIGNGD